MFDVAIVGAGVIGASIFRELTKYNLKVVIIEKEQDVAMGTSKANSAIVHAGYDPKEGTLMAKYNVRGNEMYEELCRELSVPFKRNGSLVVAYDDKDLMTLKELYENGVKNNVKELRILSKEEVLKMEPNLNENIIGALYAPTGGIVGPFEFTIALVENAIDNGGEIRLSSEVVDIKKDENFKIFLSNGEIIESRYIVNAAGIYADNVHNMVCNKEYTIYPRKGQYYVMDKNQGKVVSSTIFQCPSEKGKGVLVSPTVHGNLIVGPDSTDTEDREDIATSREQLEFVKNQSLRTTSKVNFREGIRNFAGLRAYTEREDFIIEEAKDVKGFIDVAGIKSPGLTAAPAIAERVVEILENIGLRLEKNINFNPIRKQIHFMELSNEEKADLIKKDSKYGRIICRCESITEGEIVDSIRRTLGAKTLDGVKRRCRPGMGRCQGGFCGPRVQEILSRELGKPINEIVQEREKSYILTGRTK